MRQRRQPRCGRAVDRGSVGRVLLAVGWAPLALLCVAPAGATAQSCAPPEETPPPPRHIESMDPSAGPVGTVIQVHDEQLPVYASVHLAIGQIGDAGYQVSDTLETDATGVLEGTIAVPDWAKPDQALFLMVFSEQFQPIAFSDPFHVTDGNGVVRRTGTVVRLGAECAGLDAADGVTYALVGDGGQELLASEGDRVTVEGEIVEDASNTIRVVGVERPSGGR